MILKAAIICSCSSGSQFPFTIALEQWKLEEVGNHRAVVTVGENHETVVAKLLCVIRPHNPLQCKVW